MKTSLTLDGTGRIVLPSEVRRRLNLKAGSRLQLTVLAERIELTPEAEQNAELTRSPAKRKVLKRTGATLDAAAATRAERDAQAHRRGRR